MTGSTCMPIVRVHGLVSRYGAQVVHDGLDLEVRPNEIFGVVGGSGSGKSVLLRTILGLRRPQGGSVELYGRDIQRLSPQQRLDLVKSCGVTWESASSRRRPRSRAEPDEAPPKRPKAVGPPAPSLRRADR